MATPALSLAPSAINLAANPMSGSVSSSSRLSGPAQQSALAPAGWAAWDGGFAVGPCTLSVTCVHGQGPVCQPLSPLAPGRQIHQKTSLGTPHPPLCPQMVSGAASHSCPRVLAETMLWWPQASDRQDMQSKESPHWHCIQPTCHASPPHRAACTPPGTRARPAGQQSIAP